MKVFLISQQFEGNYDYAFSSLEKTQEYLSSSDFYSNYYITEVELDNPNGEVIYHDDNEVILYRA